MDLPNHHWSDDTRLACLDRRTIIPKSTEGGTQGNGVRKRDDHVASFRRPSSVVRRPSSVVRRPSSVVRRPSSVVRRRCEDLQEALRLAHVSVGGR